MFLRLAVSCSQIESVTPVTAVLHCFQKLWIRGLPTKLETTVVSKFTLTQPDVQQISGLFVKALHFTHCVAHGLIHTGWHLKSEQSLQWSQFYKSLDLGQVANFFLTSFSSDIYSGHSWYILLEVASIVYIIVWMSGFFENNFCKIKIGLPNIQWTSYYI